MTPDRICPNCRNPVPMLAAQCVFCHAAAGGPQGGAGAAPGFEDPRFQVMRAGAGGGGAPGSHVDVHVPVEVRSLGEQDRVYYCKIGGQTVGPVTAADIRDAFSKGQIDGQASVGIQGRKEWYPVRALPQFSDMITGVRPAPTSRPAAGLPGPQGMPRAPGLPGPASAPAPPSAPHSPGFSGPGGLPGPGVPGPAPVGVPSRPALPGPGPAPARGGAPAHAPARPTPPPRGPGPGPAAGFAPSNRPRDDETLVVPPLPPPALLAVGSSTAQVHDPQLGAWQQEVRSWRRLAIIFGISSGLLLIIAATLLGLLVSG